MCALVLSVEGKVLLKVSSLTLKNKDVLESISLSLPQRN